MREWPRWVWGTIICFVGAFLFWHPLTRAVMLWLLPLGSGVDDVIVMVLLVLGVALVAGRRLQTLRLRRRKW
jgi:hypothetical protein